jgi:2,4-dienoyl-CoA reductase-like NADH-dependent reductase (Old Yellow Enzyme family)
MSAFTPCQIGKLTLKNHIIRSATHDYFGQADGHLSAQELVLYETLARNDVSCIISALTSISAEGASEPNQNRLDNDEYLTDFQLLKTKLAPYDTKLIIQLCHGGAKALNNPMHPNQMHEKQFQQIIEDFTSAAYRAKLAGADGVQIHGAHGYLLSQYLSPIENLRKDKYQFSNGGSLISTIISSIKQRCGQDYPVWIKINCNIIRNDNTLSLENEQYLTAMINMLNEAKSVGLDAVEVSGTGYGAFSKLNKPYFIEQATIIKTQTQLPTIVVGGFKTLADIEQALNNKIDAVAFSRPLIADPDLVLKLQHQSSQCISCNQCFTLPTTSGKRCIFDQ